MQVMILDEDPDFQARVARALMGRGFQVVCVDSLAAAEAFVRLDLLDLIVLGERVHGRLSHSVALLAECRSPAVPSIVLTDRTGPEVGELFDLIPAVYSILGRRTAPTMIAQIAVAAVTAQPARVGADSAAGPGRAAVAVTPHTAPPEAPPVRPAAPPAPARNGGVLSPVIDLDDDPVPAPARTASSVLPTLPPLSRRLHLG